MSTKGIARTTSQAARRLGVVVVLALLSCGCTGLFYQPSHLVYGKPKEVHHDVRFTTRDGVVLHGWLFPAWGGEPRPARGTFVQFHGNAGNITSHYAALSWVTKWGYHFFTFDYRGYGRSQGIPWPEGVNLDALAALAYVQRKVPHTLHEPDLVLVGQSLGGAVLLRALEDVRDRRRLRAVMIEGSFYSYDAIAEDVLERSPLSFLSWLAPPLVSEVTTPEPYIGDVSPIPLLVVHGDQDQTIPFRFGKEIFVRARPPKWFYRVRGGRHIDAMRRSGPRRALIRFVEHRSLL